MNNGVRILRLIEMADREQDRYKRRLMMLEVRSFEKRLRDLGHNSCL